MGKRRKTLVVLATLIGTFLAALDATVVGTAMPTIIGELGGLPLYPWAFASYLLAATVTGPSSASSPTPTGESPSTSPASSCSCWGACSPGPPRAWRRL
jgi:MFS family permease